MFTMLFGLGVASGGERYWRARGAQKATNTLADFRGEVEEWEGHCEADDSPGGIT